MAITTINSFSLATEEVADPGYFQLLADGTNGQNTFIDGGSAGKTINAFGDAQISDATTTNGGRALLCDGTGDYLTATPIPTDWDFMVNGTENWDFGAWCYFDVSGAFETIFATSSLTNQQGFTIRKTDAEKLQFFTTNGSTPAKNLKFTTGNVPTATWTYLSASFDGTNIYLGIDGTVENLGSLTNYSVSTSNSPAIGSSPNQTFQLDGQIGAETSPLTVWKRTAEYSSSFTPPTQP